MSVKPALWHRQAGEDEPEPWAVLADVEDAIRNCVPTRTGHPASWTSTRCSSSSTPPREETYQQLLAEHLESAEQIRAIHLCRLRPAGGRMTGGSRRGNGRLAGVYWADRRPGRTVV